MRFSTTKEKTKNLKYITNFAVGLALTAFFFEASSCKEPVITDKKLLAKDEELLLGTADTFAVNSFVLRETNVKTSGVGGGVLGNISDPVLGSTSAGFYANFRTTTNNINFGDNLILDSCVLVLRYRAKYGSNSQPINIGVYELDENIYPETNYYSNTSFAVKTPPVAQVSNFIPNTTDSSKVYGYAFSPQLRIKLSKDFGNKLLLADTFSLSSSSTFLSYMKGLKISVQPGSQGNGMVALDLYSSETGIILYYQNSASDSLAYTFPISSAGQTVNRFENTFGSIVNQYLNNAETVNDDVLPIISGGGTKVKITIPQLDSLQNDIAINKAEILIPLSTVYSSYDSIFTPFPTIGLYRIDDLGIEKDDTQYSNGKIETVTINGETIKRYRVNITQYAQNLIKGTYKNNGFILASPDANGARAVLANANDKNHKIALRIIYTKL